MRLLLPAILTSAFALPVMATGAVNVARVPNGGNQPQVVVGADGTVHLIAYKGDPKSADLDYYKRGADGTFTGGVRVNSEPGSAVAIGTVRGAHLALGRDGRLHVAWMGSKHSKTKAPGDRAPMFYTRSIEGGFESQRNMVDKAVGLDGGGSVAADDAGGVWVAWHADGAQEGEAFRRVVFVHSSDDGATFSAEQWATDEPTGACGCCGMRAFAHGRQIVMLYRQARNEGSERGMVLLRGAADATSLKATEIDPWRIHACPMSTASVTAAGDDVLLSWQTRKQVFFGRLDLDTGRLGAVVPAVATGKARKFSVVAVNGAGEVCFVWTEGTGWNRGGKVLWVVYDADGKPVPGGQGETKGLPAWGVPAVVAEANGDFTIYY